MSRAFDQESSLSGSVPASPPHGLHPAPDYGRMFRKFHQHNPSDSTNTAGSNDSSPTTTISTVDDSSATEPSPGSSPESPPPATFAVGMLRPRTAEEANSSFFELQKQPPPKKGRNLKNLAVNTSRHPVRGASTSSLPVASPPDTGAAILSPAFVKPPTPQKRKPNNLGLTVLTTAGSNPSQVQVKLAIPPTPAFGRPATLRHFQSSPSLPLVPGFGLPLNPSSREIQRQHALETIFSPIRTVSDPSQLGDDEEQNFDIPLSQEEKPEAYPDGPICVYDPHIDLYLEPTAEQARKYDVIMNVANEVPNPFKSHSAPMPLDTEPRLDGGGGIQYAPKRNRLSTQIHELGNTSSRDASPTTPKATPLHTTFPEDGPLSTSKQMPEYIHIPWDHNSDIVPDLLRLVKTIDDKVTDGKRVLIHCQCGVSRSASLIVAYGLYKRPSLSVQEAYDAVKKKSKWIGPNMNLIMQLQEFRSSLARGGVLNRGVSDNAPGSALSEWGGPFSERHNPPMSAVVAPSSPTKLPTMEIPGVVGPSSAPSGIPWPSNAATALPRGRAISAARPPSAYVDPAGHIVPVLQVVDADSGAHGQTIVPDVDEANSATPTEPPAAQRTAEFAMTPVLPPAEADPADAFGILSPTSTEYASFPWDRDSLLASLGMGSVRQDDGPPKRSTSLKSQGGPEKSQTLKQPAGRLRGKISSPTLREQQQLQSLQAKIEASLPTRITPLVPLGTLDETLMSPRATEFTENPFALTFSAPTTTAAAAAASSSSQLESNGVETVPRTTDSDPRSPAHKGASPITRSIFDFL